MCPDQWNAQMIHAHLLKRVLMSLAMLFLICTCLHSLPKMIDGHFSDCKLNSIDRTPRSSLQQLQSLQRRYWTACASCAQWKMTHFHHRPLSRQARNQVCEVGISEDILYSNSAWDNRVTSDFSFCPQTVNPFALLVGKHLTLEGHCGNEGWEQYKEIGHRTDIQ